MRHARENPHLYDGSTPRAFHAEDSVEELLIDVHEDSGLAPTLEDSLSECTASGHMPSRTIADNGFTYEITCARCGEPL